VKFFLDRNMSPSLVRIFQKLGLEVVHHDSMFSQSTKDPEIIEYVSRNSLTLITYDRRMSRAHRVAFREHSPTVVFLSASIGEKKIADQIEWYETTWAKACEDIVRLAPKTQARVAVSGAIRIVWNPDQSEDAAKSDDTAA
jgi:predicted nuclease of predicted toxin-antitoxin system